LINNPVPALAAERRHVRGYISWAPGPRAVWQLRTVFVLLKRSLTSCITANYYRCLLLLRLQCHFVNSREIPRKCVNSVADGKFRGPRKTVGTRNNVNCNCSI
jgi:hypothetical protein